MRAFKMFIIAFVLTAGLFSSCAEEEGSLNIQLSPGDKNLLELASIRYADEQLFDIINNFHSIVELNSHYPIECIREKNGIYRVSFLGNGTVAVLIFDASGNKAVGSVFKTQVCRSEFVSLESQHLEDVLLLDSAGEYLFLYSGRNDLPRESFHYTKDGYLITISYNDANEIVLISDELL